MTHHSKTGTHLVVGADSMIGSALLSYLARAGENVIGTTRRPDRVDDHLFALDLAEDFSDWAPPQPIRTAYICAGVTKLEACRKDPEGTARVNVTGTCTLVKKLVEHGAFVIFLSTNQVFDGSKPFMEPDHPHCPVTEYGRQKAAVEKFLFQWQDAVAIVRLTKVLGPSSILSRWSKDLLAGQAIQPFSDMVMAPIPLPSVVCLLRLIADIREGGMWQISADRDVSYAEAGRCLAENLGVDSALVKPVTASSVLEDLEANPANTSLDTQRLEGPFGLKIPPFEWNIYQEINRHALHNCEDMNL